MLGNNELGLHNNWQIGEVQIRSVKHRTVSAGSLFHPRPQTGYVVLSPSDCTLQSEQMGRFRGCKWQFTEQVIPTNVFGLAHTGVIFF